MTKSKYWLRWTRPPGFAFIDFLQPCTIFNKVNTYGWFKKSVYDINEEGHNPDNSSEAFKVAIKCGDRIPTGVFYDEPKTRPVFNETLISAKISS